MQINKELQEIIDDNIQNINNGIKKACKEITSFSQPQIRNYLHESASIKLRDDHISNEILSLFKKENYQKSKIKDISNKFSLYHDDVEKFLIRKTHHDLEKKINKNSLADKLLEIIFEDSGFDKKRFNFIRTNLANLFPYSFYHFILNGYNKNTVGIDSGIMSANAGDSSEHFFVARAILAGFNASVVDVRSSAYDVVIDINNRLLKVQVKSSDNDVFSRKGRDRGGQGIDPTDPTNRGKIVSSKDTDLLVFVMKKTGTIFIFPKNEIDKLPTTLKGRDYIKNMENWDLIS